MPLQDLLETVLTEAGFEVVLAGNGMRALANLDAMPMRFKGVVTDINLGRGPTGWDVGKHARAVVHNMPIVYMTGGAAHEWLTHGVPGSVLITKPFTLHHFVSSVSTLPYTGNTLVSGGQRPGEVLASPRIFAKSSLTK